jgi:hypothetical protein
LFKQLAEQHQARKITMATLGDLIEQFGGEAADIEESTGSEKVASETNFAVEDGQTKTASGGDEMKSLTDIYLSMTDLDMAKEAQVAANVPEFDQEFFEDPEVDMAKLAEAIAGAEAEEIVQEDGEIVKVAQEYDSAGRIMARGFYDEFMKLAGAMDTDVASNQTTESPSAASTPALGNRGLPTVETNFAGNEAHDGQIETAGPGGKQVYKDVLKPAKTISAGQGTGDDPEAAAISLGGGSPAGFATVKDLQA